MQHVCIMVHVTCNAIDFAAIFFCVNLMSSLRKLKREKNNNICWQYFQSIGLV